MVIELTSFPSPSSCVSVKLDFKTMCMHEHLALGVYSYMLVFCYHKYGYYYYFLSILYPLLILFIFNWASTY